MQASLGVRYRERPFLAQILARIGDICIACGQFWRKVAVHWSKPVQPLSVWADSGGTLVEMGQCLSAIDNQTSPKLGEIWPDFEHFVRLRPNLICTPANLVVFHLVRHDLQNRLHQEVARLRKGYLTQWLSPLQHEGAPPGALPSRCATPRPRHGRPHSPTTAPAAAATTAPRAH